MKKENESMTTTASNEIVLFDVEKTEEERRSDRRDREAYVRHEETEKREDETKGSDESSVRIGQPLRAPSRTMSRSPRPSPEMLREYHVFKSLYPEPFKNSSVFLAVSEKEEPGGPSDVVVLKSVRLDMSTERTVANVYAWLTHQRVPGLISPIKMNVDASGKMDLVLPFVEDSDLVNQVLRDGPLQENVCRRMTRRIAHGLMRLHESGVVHRDVSGENVLLSVDAEGGDAVLIDFGSCRLASDARNYSDISGVKREYLAPEIVSQQRDIDFGKADVFSLGCVLYIALFGHPPFEIAYKSDARFHVMHNHGLRCMLERLDVNIASICSNDAVDLLERMLRVDPTRRPNAREVLRHSWFKLLDPRPRRNME